MTCRLEELSKQHKKRIPIKEYVCDKCHKAFWVQVWHYPHQCPHCGAYIDSDEWNASLEIKFLGTK